MGVRCLAVAVESWPGSLTHLITGFSHLPSTFVQADAVSGFDIVIMSDLLHFDSSHAALVDSLAALLAKSGGSRAYVAAGRYTKQDVCDRFIDQARRAGILLVEEHVQQAGWQGEMAVRGRGLDREGLERRRDASRLWVGRWIDRMAEQAES